MQIIELKENDERIVLIASASGFSVTGVTQAIQALAKAAQDIAKVISGIWEVVKAGAREINELLEQRNFEEIDREWKHDLHKLDFTRPIIQHQVVCRKPKYLIKKIIH